MKDLEGRWVPSLSPSCSLALPPTRPWRLIHCIVGGLDLLAPSGLLEHLLGLPSTSQRSNAVSSTSGSRQLSRPGSFAAGKGGATAADAAAASASSAPASTPRHRHRHSRQDSSATSASFASFSGQPGGATGGGAAGGGGAGAAVGGGAAEKGPGGTWMRLADPAVDLLMAWQIPSSQQADMKGQVSEPLKRRG